MKKNNSGITLISLVITIIVLLILASIGIISGINTVRSSQLTKFTTEMKIMQLEVNDLYDSYANNRSVNVNETEYIGKGQEATGSTEAKPGIQEIGKDISSAPQDKLNQATSGSGINITTEYRYYDQSTIQALEIDGVEGEFFINIVNRQVISVDGFEYEGEEYYTLEQLPNSLYNVDYNPTVGTPTFDVSCEQIEDSQWRVTISNIQYDGYINKWYVKYQEEGQDHWSTIEEFDFVVYERGKYIIKVANGDVESEEKEVNIWTQNGTQVISGSTILEVGDFVDYDHTLDVDMSNENEISYQSKTQENGYGDQEFNLNSYVDMRWRVLGEENGNLLLISEKTIGPDSGGYIDGVNGNQYYIKGQNGYVNGVQELNNICALFGNARHAKAARSVNVDDINRVTGFNPNNIGVYDSEQTGNGIKSYAETIYEYGNEVTYYWEGTIYPYYIGSNGYEGTLTNTHSSTFNWYDEVGKKWNISNKSLSATTSKKEEIATLKNTYYIYYPQTLDRYDEEDMEKVGIDRNSNPYDNLFKNVSYWLASTYVTTGTNAGGCGLRQVSGGMVVANSLYYTNEYPSARKYGVRPVVSINYNLKFVPEDEIWNIEE